MKRLYYRFTLRWSRVDFIGTNMAVWEIGGGIIGYALGYVLLQVKKK